MRARWHRDPAVIELTDDDPFDVPQRIEDVGLPINLATEPDLFALLTRNIHAQSALYEHGVDCAVKESPDTSCHACPLYGSQGELCALGREQERLVTLIAVERHGGGR